MRPDGRQYDEVRPVQLNLDFVRYPEGSVLYRAGDTVVLCNVSLVDRTAPFLRGTGEGWLTAEYAMLPRATEERSVREVVRGRPSGRSQEIQRLIGRSLRMALDLTQLGERTLQVDCDVLQADGSTRTAAISGSWVAVVLALLKMWSQGVLPAWPLKHQVAAVAVGLLNGRPAVDLDYGEDFDCEVDANLVFTGAGKLIEVQGTAESLPFSRGVLTEMVEAAWAAASQIMTAQREVVGDRLAEHDLDLPSSAENA